MSHWLLGGVAFFYLTALALLAYAIEARPRRFRAWTTHPLTYTLALTVYDTGWAYFGIGTAILSYGVAYLAQEIGWSFLFLCAWPLVMRVIQIAKVHHVSTLPDFFALRFGPSSALSVLVSLLLIVALLPYIALQIEALSLAVQPLAGSPGAFSPSWGLVVTLSLCFFAALFGARKPDPTQRHEGLVAMVAVSAIVKLASAGAVAVFVLWRFGGFWPLTAAFGASPSFAGNANGGYVEWVGNFALGLVSILLLPHVFHVTVIEYSAPRQLYLARWAWPLYAWLFRVAVLVIAMAGVLSGLTGAAQQTAILTLPRAAGHGALSLFAYLGGVAASTAMAIVAILALANTAMLDLVLPALSRHTARLGPYLLPMRWGLMLAIALLGYGVWLGTHEVYLYRLGMLAFLAVALLAPPFFLGLVWARPQRSAAVWAIALSSLVWLYTAFLPSFSTLSPSLASLAEAGPWGLGFLRPHALFGVVGLDPFVHSFFWCMLVNVGVFLAWTAWRPSRGEEARRVEALLQGELPEPPPTQALRHVASLAEMEELLARFVGAERARTEMAELRTALEQFEPSDEVRLLMARNALKRLLSGPLGTTAASRLLDEQFPISERTLLDVMEAYQKLEQMLSLSQEDLASRVRELSVLNAASERIVSLHEPERLLCSLAELLADSFRFELVGSFLFEGGAPRLCCAQGLRMPPGAALAVPEGSVLAAALTEGQPRVLAAAQARDPLDPLMASEGLQTLVYVPLGLDGQVLGLWACGVRTRSLYMSADFLRLLRAIANETAVALAAAQHRQREHLVRSQLEATLENLADPVMIFDLERRVVLANAATLALFQAPGPDFFLGCSLAEVIARTAGRDLSGRPLTLAETPTQRAFEGQSTAHAGAIRMRSLTGRGLVLSVSSTPIRDAAGAVVQVVTVYRDITELYALKEELEALVAKRTAELSAERDRLHFAIADLRNLDKVKGAFVNAISHDLRIPLTGIVGYAEFLDDELVGALNAEQHGYVGQILEASDRMTKLLDDLLDYARLEAGKFKVEPVALDAAEALTQALDAFKPQLSKKGVEGRLELAPGLPRFLADPARVQQVLANLLSNAVKFTPEGGTVSLRARVEGKWGIVEVVDNGVGIGPEALSHIFERFYQTEAGRQAGGTGLGLSITKSLIEAQGGWVGIESTVGKGSTFRFGLPLAS